MRDNLKNFLLYCSSYIASTYVAYRYITTYSYICTYICNYFIYQIISML